MRKIPTLFARDFEHNPRYVTRTVTPGCEWVIKGEGTPTRKYDGTCVQMTPDGAWWARREVKPGKTPPPAFVALEIDDETGKTAGWEPVGQSGFARWHAEALAAGQGSPDKEAWAVGTYELLGPKINGNPEHFAVHVLLFHLSAQQIDAPRDFDGLAGWLHAHSYEGIVWHHPDGRMVKIKKRDFPG
jgi:hypothetical protein